MIKRLILPSLAITLAGSITHGQWTKIQDFENGLDGFDTTLSTDFTSQSVLEDTLESGNHAFYLESGGYGVEHMNTTFSVCDLPTPIADGETGTVYFRFRNDGPDNDFHFCLTDVAKTTDADGNFLTPSGWGDMETVLRLTNDGLASVRDGGFYPYLGTGNDATDFDVFMPEAMTWYEFWIVAHNETGMGYDYYNIYVKGGAFTEQTLLKCQVINPSTEEVTDELSEEIYFRNTTDTALVNVLIGTQSGWMGEPYLGEKFYVDDIYQAGGVELSSGAGGTSTETWMGYPVNVYDAGEWVDTGSWLGSVDITTAPFIFLYSLNQWAYVEDDSGWVYVYK